MSDCWTAMAVFLGWPGASKTSRRIVRSGFRLGLAIGIWIAVAGCVQSMPAGSAAEEGPDWTIERTRPVEAEGPPAIAVAASPALVEARAADDEVKRENWRRIGRFFRGVARWMEAAFLYPARQPR